MPSSSSYSEKSVSYLIGLLFQSLIQQCHKSRVKFFSLGNIYIYMIKVFTSQRAELFIYKKTWDKLRKMQSTFFPSISHPTEWVFLHTLGEFTFLKHSGFHWVHHFTVSFASSFSIGIYFFSYSIHLTRFLGVQYRVCTANAASIMLASFNVTRFQHFEKDATVTSAAWGASVALCV